MLGKHSLAFNEVRWVAYLSGQISKTRSSFIMLFRPLVSHLTWFPLVLSTHPKSLSLTRDILMLHSILVLHFSFLSFPYYQQCLDYLWFSLPPCFSVSHLFRWAALHYCIKLLPCELVRKINAIMVRKATIKDKRFVDNWDLYISSISIHSVINYFWDWLDSDAHI